MSSKLHKYPYFYYTHLPLSPTSHFFFGLKFCTAHVGSFCLFFSVFFLNVLLAFAYFINKLKKTKVSMQIFFYNKCVTFCLYI